MLKTTVGQLLINEALPEDLRDYSREYDKKTVNSVLEQVARQYPEKYREISFQLGNLGRRFAHEQGGFSFGAEHLLKSKAAQAIQDEVKSKVQTILDNDKLTPAQRREQIVLTTGRESERLQKAVMQEALDAGNPLALQIISGTRGKPMNLASLLGSDMLYADHRDRPIPIPVLRSYAQGLSQAEYWAGTYGARKGVLATKFCLAKGTEVLMSDFTHKPIEQVRPGDEVLTLDEHDCLTRTRVVRRYVNGVRPCSTFYFREGRSQSLIEVTATDEHKVYAEYRAKDGIVKRRMLPLGALGKGRRAAVVPRGAFSGRPEPLAGLLGAILGDGGVSTQNTNFFSADPHAAALLNAELLSSNLQLVQANEIEGCRTYRISEIVPSFGIGGGVKTPLRAWLAELDVLGKKASAKTIPAAAWTWDCVSCGRLAAWLLETDGCYTTATNQQGKTYPVVSFYVTSEALAVSFRRLLQQKLGIYATPVVRRDVKDKPYVFTEPERSLPYRVGTRNEDLYGFHVSSRGEVEKLAEYWRDTGTKAAHFQAAVRAHVKNFAVDLPRRYVGCTPRGELPTYDLEVEHPSHRFVLANMLVVSNSTQNAGFFSKQLNAAAHRLVVTGEDDDEFDTESPRGFPVDADDPDSEGALLAVDTGPYKRNTVLTPKIIKHLKRLGKNQFLVRSPTVGGSPDGGLFARDVGVRERGSLPGRGEIVGLSASQALSEPISQGQLSAKHSGGVAGQEKAVSGFDLLNQLVQVPKKMRGGAAHATADGQVDSIEPAPAGGFNVMVSGAKHYVPSGLDLKIQVGDKVEAGDLLSDGIPNPAVIVEHKGVGEGRRYFVNEFRKAMQESGMSANRRNIELLARGLINHVQLTDEYDDYVPDDVVPYSSIERSWQPRNGAASAPPQAAVGKYLERPVLHYTIGTKIQPSMLKQFEQFGVQKVTVHDDPPPFKPHMVRGMYQMQNDPDWMTQMYGSGLKKSLLTSTARGATSDPGGTSFVPSLAIGKDFGNVPGRAIQAPKPSYDLPQVPLPDSNLLSYKEATEATGVDTTKGMPSSNVLPTRLPPAAPASPMPSGPRAPSYSSAPYGGTMAGAEQLRQMGAGTSLGAPSTRRWGSPVASQGPTPSVMPQAPKSAPQPPAQTQPVDPTLKSMGPYGLTSSIGATRTLLATPIAAAQSYATAIPAVSSTLQRATNLAGQARTAAPWLAKAAPVVRGGAMMSGLTKGTPALAGVMDAVGTVSDIYDKGHFAVGDEQIAHLRHIVRGDYGLATPLHAANAVFQPVRNANAAGVALTHTLNELRDGGAEAVGYVARNTWQNFTGSNEQIKDPSVSSAMLNNASLPARIDSSLGSLRQQLAGESDLARQQQLRDRIGRIETLRKSYDANAGLLGTGQFSTLLTGNLQGMKQTLNSVEQQLRMPNLDPAQRQDLLNRRQRLHNDISTYQGWLQ